MKLVLAAFTSLCERYKVSKPGTAIQKTFGVMLKDTTNIGSPAWKEGKLVINITAADESLELQVKTHLRANEVRNELNPQGLYVANYITLPLLDCKIASEAWVVRELNKLLVS